MSEDGVIILDDSEIKQYKISYNRLIDVGYKSIDFRGTLQKMHYNLLQRKNIIGI